MSEPIQTTVNIVEKAANNILDQGILGSFTVLLLVVVVILAYAFWKRGDRYIKHLEKHQDNSD